MVLVVTGDNDGEEETFTSAAGRFRLWIFDRCRFCGGGGDGEDSKSGEEMLHSSSEDDEEEEEELARSIMSVDLLLLRAMHWRLETTGGHGQSCHDAKEKWLRRTFTVGPDKLRQCLLL